MRPPWPAILGFRAAARRLSFRDAALDLGVTPSAVSHQVKALELWLGTPLFIRGIRRIELTDAGAALAAELERALQRLDDTLDAARARAGPGRLAISTLPLFAAGWLDRRIGRFEDRFPNLAIAVDTAARIADLEAGDADVAIRNVERPTAGLWAHKLLDVRAVPLCAPELAERIGSIDDLAHQRLIELNGSRRGWGDWFAAVGRPGVEPSRRLVVDSLVAALEAAANGRGVVLGLSPLVWDLPVAARLAAPLDIPAPTGGSYFLLCRKSSRADPIVRAFTDWIIAEMRSDLGRLRAIARDR